MRNNVRFYSMVEIEIVSRVLGRRKVGQSLGGPLKVTVRAVTSPRLSRFHPPVGYEVTYEGSAGEPESAPVEVALGRAHADLRHVEVLGNSTTGKYLHLVLRRTVAVRRSSR